MNIAYWASLLGLMSLQLVVCLVAWRHLSRRLRAIAEAQQRAAATDVPTSMLVTGMARIEARLQQLESTRKPLPAPEPQSSDRAYQLAQRMARNGADAAKIMETCGITLHEAELLTHLHGPVL